MGAPPEKQNVEHALMISQQDCRSRVKVLLALYHNRDIQPTARNSVEAPRDNPIDIEPPSNHRHPDGRDDAPDRADAQCRQIQPETDIVTRDGIRLAHCSQDEDGE